MKYENTCFSELKHSIIAGNFELNFGFWEELTVTYFLRKDTMKNLGFSKNLMKLNKTLSNDIKKKYIVWYELILEFKYSNKKEHNEIAATVLNVFLCRFWYNRFFIDFGKIICKCLYNNNTSQIKRKKKEKEKSISFDIAKLIE